MSKAAANADVLLVTGDTKVVDRGKADGCFVTTTGVGVVEHAQTISADRARPGDVVILSGPIAEHGMAIMAARADLELETPVASDTAPLHRLVHDMLATGAAIHCLRDPTRGGVATALNEIAQRSAAAASFSTRRPSPSASPCAACASCSASTRSMWRMKASCSPSCRRTTPDAVLDAMRRHPEGARRALSGRSWRTTHGWSF